MLKPKFVFASFVLLALSFCLIGGVTSGPPGTGSGTTTAQVSNIVTSMTDPANSITTDYAWVSGGVTNASVNTNGTVTALHFSGDGSALTGISGSGLGYPLEFFAGSGNMDASTRYFIGYSPNVNGTFSASDIFSRQKVLQAGTVTGIFINFKMGGTLPSSQTVSVYGTNFTTHTGSSAISVALNSGEVIAFGSTHNSTLSSGFAVAVGDEAMVVIDTHAWTTNATSVSIGGRLHVE